MPKYHLTYSGPHHIPETDEDLAAMMKGWEDWFTELGAALLDPGSPFGPRQTIDADGTIADTGSANGYGVIEADNLADALAKTKSCPVLTLGPGNKVEVSECLEM